MLDKRGDGQRQLASIGTNALTPLCAPALAATLTTPSARAGHTLLHAAGFTVGWPNWLDAAGLSDMPARHLWCDTQSMTLRLAAQGCGIALAHRGLVGDRQIRAAPFDLTCPAHQQFVLTRPERRSLRPPAERFWNHLVATID